MTGRPNRKRHPMARALGLIVRDRAVRLSSLALIAALVTAACAIAPPTPSPEVRHDELLADKRFFELRRILESPPAGMSPTDLLYLRGRTANAFNRLAESIDALTSYLREAETTEPEARVRDALGTLADDYVKTFQYAKAAEVRRRLRPLLKGVLPPDLLADFEATTGLWATFAATPPQSVAVPADTDLSAQGTAGIPVTIGGRNVALLPDTGSSVSVLSRAEVQGSGVRLVEVAVDIVTSTGQQVRAQGAVADELRLDRIVVRNAIFLIVPESQLYFPDIKEQRMGLLGFPLLAGLKEMTFTRSGGLQVPARPRLSGPPNFFLERENPVLETDFLGRRLLFHLDTGAGQTELYPRFFRAFQDRIVRHGAPVGENIEGVGTSITVPAYLVQGITFRLAGREVLFDRPIPVLTRPTGTNSEEFDGVLGLDVLNHFRSLTINYEAMRIAID